MRIVFLGDVVGRSGRAAIIETLPRLRERYRADFVVINGENAAGGFGISEQILTELLDAGADVVTTGNHVWDQRETLIFIERHDRLLRPINFPKGAPGRGAGLFKAANGADVLVINAMGRVFMGDLDCPFRAVDAEIEACGLKRGADAILIDFHAEATSEKIAMAWHLDGRATAVFGTHTHVQTADERILPKGTACLTDVGMTGPHDSIIGVTVEAALGRFLTGMPAKFEAATGPARLNAVVVTADPATGKATAIERLNLSAQDVEALAGASAPSR